MENEPRRLSGAMGSDVHASELPEPIRTERQAQRIASARDRRDHVIWSIDGPDEAA